MTTQYNLKCNSILSDSTLVDRSHALADVISFICKGLLNKTPRSNEAMSLKNKIEITL